MRSIRVRRANLRGAREIFIHHARAVRVLLLSIGFNGISAAADMYNARCQWRIRRKLARIQ